MSRCDAILQDLKAQLHCAYISDLHQAYRCGGLRGVVPPEAGDPFTPEDWTEVVGYITGTEQTFSSGAEAIRFLARPPGHQEGGPAGVV